MGCFSYDSFTIQTPGSPSKSKNTFKFDAKILFINKTKTCLTFLYLMPLIKTAPFKVSETLLCEHTSNDYLKQNTVLNEKFDMM